MAVTSNGVSCQSFQSSSILPGGDSWAVYRFLTQDHPELEGDTALSGLQRGKVSEFWRQLRKQPAPSPGRDAPVASQGIRIERYRAGADQNWNDPVPAVSTDHRATIPTLPNI
jgi:hypothetical protein